MTAVEIINRLRDHGVEVVLAGDRLKLRAPAEPTEEARQLIETLRARKAEVLAALQGWNQAEACRLLVSVQKRLGALLGDAPVPEMDMVVSSAYARLATAHDAKDWPGFLAALEGFEASWRERIARH